MKNTHLDEKRISEIIIDSFCRKFKNALDCDVAVVGSGPSGLICSYFLAKSGFKTALFERRGSLGGGIWGGGMLFNDIVVQGSVKRLLDEFGIRHKKTEDSYLVAGAPEMVSALALSACRAGVEIFTFVHAEDLIIKSGKVKGLVLNWTPVNSAGLHVDPLSVESKYVVDATGHDHALSKVLMDKLKADGRRGGSGSSNEKAMNAERGEMEVVRNSKEVFPGLYVTGMAANAVFGGHRMGPIFGGMLLSGEKVARSIIVKLKKERDR